MSNELYKKFNPINLEYRLYYDENGNPLTMSSHNHPIGNYIIITKEQYEKPNYNCKVISGKLQFDLKDQFRVQLKKSDSGVAVVRGHAGLVLENDTYEEVEYYDRNS